MVFKFYINDIEIDEPVGFDGTKIMLKRSDNWHGVLSEASEDNVEIYGQGFEILSALYNEFGIDAVAKMRIEYYCSGVLEDNVEYNITFYDYKEYCGNDCYCEVGIERAGCYYQFRNAMETKVNLDALTAIDKTTDLADYEYLGKEIEIPGKSILFTNSAKSESIINGGIISTDYDRTDYIHMPFPRIELDEYETFSPLDTYVQEQILNVESNFIYKSYKTTNYELSTSFSIGIIQIGYSTGALSFHNQCSFEIWKKSSGVQSLIYNEIFPQYDGDEDNQISYNVNINYADNISLNINDMISIIFKIRLWVTTGQPDDCPLSFNIAEGSKFKIVNLDSYIATPAKLYLPNEALSHISEYNTNNCMRVYSEYLGRTDSQPYSQIIDGCGGMLGITNGLFLRQLEYTRTGDKTPILSLSFNEILEALNCINPIGFSIEKRGEDEVVRVENWEYFYNDSIVVDLGTVSVKKEPDVKLHFKNFKTGYAKYEAEEYNGLDEFLTEREYTTNLVNHNLELNKTCQFIASGYAIELTRRTGNTTSSDWRFDNDTFVIALKRSGTTLDVEQGNITSPLNIIDPPTILNFRISPARMAMNWFQYLTTFLKTTKELIFSSGKGNIAAQGESYSNCTIESGVISEKQNLLQADFQGNQDGIFTAELHTISEAPMTFKQYKLIQGNPHGLIAYKCSDVQLYGWIKELKYSFIDGSASFILIPKVNI